MLVFVALPEKRSRRFSFPRVRRPSTSRPSGSGPRRAVVVINSRIVGQPEVIAGPDLLESLPWLPVIQAQSRGHSYVCAILSFVALRLRNPPSRIKIRAITSIRP
jgi:hypothetical protein